MSADEFTTAMRAVVAQNADPEAAHLAADDLLVKFLRSLGYDEAMDAYEAVEKWYA